MLPDREPDLILPAISNRSVKIEMWIEEKLFRLRGTSRGFTSIVARPFAPSGNTLTPLEYIKKAATDSRFPLHRQLCADYLFYLELEKELGDTGQ